MLIQKPTLDRNRLHDVLYELSLTIRMKGDALRGYPSIRRRTAKSLRYDPDIHAPETYNEKILWRKIRDRNPIFPVVTDKVRVRDFVADRLGEAPAKGLFPELYAVESRARDLDFSNLPERYVIKANHGRAWNVFVTPEDPLDEDRLRLEAARWLRRSYGKVRQEWAYQPIPRRVLIEEMLIGADGTMANDIKFAVFNGQCRFIVVVQGRFGDHCWYHMTPDWQRLLSTPRSASENPLPEKPYGFDHMLEIAETVSQGVDFFRVDFLTLPDRFALNEITLYDASGMDPLDPPVWDHRFGDYWTLPARK